MRVVTPNSAIARAGSNCSEELKGSEGRTGVCDDEGELRRAIRAVAKKLGRTPTRREFGRVGGIGPSQHLKFHSTWNEAVKGAGLEPWGKNARIEDDELMRDFGKVARKLKGIPSRARYGRMGRYDWSVMSRRFGGWRKMGERFVRFAERKKEWRDVAGMMAGKKSGGEAAGSTSAIASGEGRKEMAGVYRRRAMWDSERAMFGEPIGFRSLAHEPTEEVGVIFLFGILAEELGFSVEGIRGRFPDCVAKRRVRPGRWERVRIEFEFESRNFRDHGHRAEGCDLIVCWSHNWDECPVEVLELRGIVKNGGGTKGKARGAG